MGVHPLHGRCVLRCGCDVNQSFELVAIALQVVARGDGEARSTFCVAQSQAFYQQLRQCRRVSLFSHGQCDPPRAGGGNGFDHTLTLGGGHAGLPQCARYLPFNTFCSCNANRIQTVLRAKFVHQSGLGHAHAMNAPAHITFTQQLIKHHGLVRAVKRS